MLKTGKTLVGAINNATTSHLGGNDEMNESDVQQTYHYDDEKKKKREQAEKAMKTINKNVREYNKKTNKVGWADDIANPENEEFIVEVAFNLGIDKKKVTQRQFTSRYPKQ